jgi:hypothetical protein
VRASLVAAAEAPLRCTFPDLRRKYRHLLIQLFAAAVFAASAFARFAGEVFQKLIYLAALTAFILINRHKKLPVIKKSRRQDSILPSPPVSATVCYAITYAKILLTIFLHSIYKISTQNKTNIQKNPLKSVCPVLKESITQL